MVLTGKRLLCQVNGFALNVALSVSCSPLVYTCGHLPWPQYLRTTACYFGYLEKPVSTSEIALYLHPLPGEVGWSLPALSEELGNAACPGCEISKFEPNVGWQRQTLGFVCILLGKKAQEPGLLAGLLKLDDSG